MSADRITLWVVDRVEGRGAQARVVLVSDEGAQRELPRAALGNLAVEGAVLRVPGDEQRPEWAAAVRDRAEERRRTDEAKERLKKLSAGDTGGDLEL
jgi:hypothetical protein